MTTSTLIVLASVLLLAAAVSSALPRPFVKRQSHKKRRQQERAAEANSEFGKALSRAIGAELVHDMTGNRSVRWNITRHTTQRLRLAAPLHEVGTLVVRASVERRQLLAKRKAAGATPPPALGRRTAGILNYLVLLPADLAIVSMALIA